MEADVPVYDVREMVFQYVKQAKCMKTVNKAIHELEAVYRNAVALGCDCPITVAPFLAYNATQHNGVFWQMSVTRDDHKSSAKHRSGNLIAAGGRYDALVEEFWKVSRTEKDQDNEELNITSVGFSMALERMAAIVIKMEKEVLPIQHIESTLIYVCIWGIAGSGRDGLAASKRAQLAKDLWGSGFDVCLWTQSHLDAHETRHEGIVLWEDDAVGRMAFWGKNGVRELKVPYAEVLDFIKQKLRPDSIRNSENSTNNRLISWTETEKPNSIISVTFITASERMTKNSKRHIENQINTQITSILANLGLSSKARINVLALACEASAVRTLVAQLSIPLHASELSQTLSNLQHMFIKRQSIIEEALNELGNLVKQASQNRSDESQLYALYSIPDSVCRLIT